jgi:hypothetical protein
VCLQKGVLSVFVDAKNTGRYATCMEGVQLGMPDGWSDKVYVGVTATTGQLADNHDILSLIVTYVCACRCARECG